uniref:hypothetical protein n=1 Tax=uncultured Legionella sp. TaxID=210934 RepID=UPI0026174FB3
MLEDQMDLGIKIGNKNGGIHNGDDFCGLYRSDSTLYLVKRDLNNSANDIAEYLSSRLFNKIAPGYGAEIN